MLVKGEDEAKKLEPDEKKLMLMGLQNGRKKQP